MPQNPTSLLRPRRPVPLVQRVTLLFFFFLLLPSDAPAVRCGTSHFFDAPSAGKKDRLGARNPPLPARTALAKRALDFGETAGRTWVTPHFRIRYSLRGIHQVKRVPGDSALSRLADSLYAAFRAHPAFLADSSESRLDARVHARLDSLNAPHPLFVQRTRDHFEAAYAYYVDTLKMRAPTLQNPEGFYADDGGSGTGFLVELVDIGEADPAFFCDKPECAPYGVTYPPPDLHILLDNDFLYNARLDTLGRVLGDSVRSIYRDSVLNDYAVDWDKGIKVTAFHEFYHAVQFTYNPGASSYHTWYEASATGMEERKAPEVNDYWQYLPYVFERNASEGLFEAATTPGRYGQAAFHLFLSRELGPEFDVRIWARLRENQDDLPEAFRHVFASYGKDAQTLFGRYARSLFSAGGRPGLSGEPFTPDLAHWPRIEPDMVNDLADTQDRYRETLSPFTFALARLTGRARDPKIARTLPPTLGLFLLRTEAEKTVTEDGSGRTLTLTEAPAGAETHLLFSNGNTLSSGIAEIRNEADLYARFVSAHPNPVKLADERSRLRFARVRRADSVVTVRIVDERGTRVKDLAFGRGEAEWVWDLRNDRNQRIPPGLYFFREGNGAYKPLVVLEWARRK